MKDTPFSFDLPDVKTVLGREELILESCKGKKVLHLGCADEGFTKEKFVNGRLKHQKLIEISDEVWGLDYSKESIELMRKYGIDNLIVGDLEDIDKIKELENQHFNIILLTEVLEHLNNPGIVLRKLKGLFNEDTILIITVPNGLSLTYIYTIIRGYEAVHPDHNYWFSYKTLENLLRKNGYTIEDIAVYTHFDCMVPVREKISKKLNIFIKRNNNGNLINPQNISNHKNNEEINENNQNNNKNSSKFNFIYLTLEYLLRRYFYKRNNKFFVSDGIITFVRPI